MLKRAEPVLVTTKSELDAALASRKVDSVIVEGDEDLLTYALNTAVRDGEEVQVELPHAHATIVEPGPPPPPAIPKSGARKVRWVVALSIVTFVLAAGLLTMQQLSLSTREEAATRAVAEAERQQQIQILPSEIARREAARAERQRQTTAPQEQQPSEEDRQRAGEAEANLLRAQRRAEDLERASQQTSLAAQLAWPAVAAIAIIALLWVSLRAISAGSNVEVSWKVTEKVAGRLVISKVRQTRR